ncbi:MAG TPA: choice-of-anchor D domain-containing protein [Candidatus Sulfotelmatobacter sp.]|nr:choice-of-anchor D domain-containing protein [Candidatus Sulfotelmatobacter sp.]
MRSMLRFCLFVVVCSIFAGIQPSAAQSFSFPVNGFTTSNVCANSATPPPACQVLTNGSPSQPQVVNNGVLRLTTANTNQHGSAWFHMQQPLSSGFTTAFQFQISNTNSCFFCGFPADGLALVIQADPAGTGAIGYTGNGQNMAYGDNDIATASGPGNAILNSLAIELDTHQNSDYDDPDGNHIAVQSCGPNTPSALSANSADHNYICPNGNLAKIALQSLPQGMSLTDGLTHTITVNYLPPGNCTSGCNNLSVYFDSTLILQATVNIAQQLNLTSGTSAYIGFTAATGSLVENNDIVSWSFSQWPLSPITINQPLQPTVTNFNYTSTLSAVTNYSQSGLGSGSFQGVFMQGTVQAITDAQFNTLVSNTPFQGSTCQHQDTGNGNYSCVVTTDLCTTPTNSVAAGANCLTTTNPVIVVSNTYNIDPSQKPIIAPNYIMGKDTALSCLSTDDNTCKGLVSIFTGINGDIITSSGGTKNFNSILIPILGAVAPNTSITTSPALNSGWINGPVTLTFNSADIAPSNNSNPPSPLPTVTSINYSVTGANVSSPASGTISGSTGSISIPGAVEGTTTITYSGVDSAGSTETTVTNGGNTVSTSTPTFTYSVDLTKPTVTCTPPVAAWQATDVSVPCTASDNAGGSGLVGPSSFSVQSSVPTGTETNSATIPPVTVSDVAGNVSLPQPAQGSFGPFEVDKKAPVIVGPTVSPASPTFGQTVTATYSCTDGGSGVVLCGPTGTAQIPPTANTGTLTSTLDGSVGTHTFTVNAQDLVNNASSPSSVTYTVSKASPVITWANPAAITYGTALSGTQLNATASVAGTFLYSPASGAVLTAGTQTLSATFTPSDSTDYATVTVTAQLIVNKATPILTWPTPAPISYGTPLSSTQLDATASVPGTFLYTPAAGAILAAGTQTLSVTFTPTDSVDYNGASAQVSLQVTAPALTFSPASMNFGTVNYGKLVSQYETVTNSGSSTVTFTNVSATTSDWDDFIPVSGCFLPLAPGQSCSVLVFFYADETGTRTGTLNFTDNASGSPQSIPLTGTVVKTGKNNK